MVIDFSKGFPGKVPPMNFRTKLWHTAVSEDTGAICTAEITPWLTNSGPQKLIEHVSSLLAHPERSEGSNINPAACEQFRNEHAAYIAKESATAIANGHD